MGGMAEETSRIPRFIVLKQVVSLPSEYYRDLEAQSSGHFRAIIPRKGNAFVICSYFSSLMNLKKDH